MKLVIQRVLHASVTVDKSTVGKISHGLLVFVGVEKTDTQAIIDKFVSKLVRLRIFDDADGRTNLSISDVNGELLLISQFTLMADCRGCNRPGFTDAGDPVTAKELYDYMVEQSAHYIPVVQHGIFGAEMKVELLNDGPFTIILDNHQLKLD